MKNHLLHVQIKSNTLLSCIITILNVQSQRHCWLQKGKYTFFQKASKVFGLILHCFTSSLPKNGLENLRQRLNGQRQAKSNPRLVTCFTLKDQWLLPINSVVLFGFNAHVKINVIENVTRVNNNTEILKFIMLNITGESNAPPAVREF